jgi:hypothetical protein
MESFEKPKQIQFEDGPSISSEQEALRLIAGGKYGNTGENRDVEGYLHDTPSEPYISQIKISGWPEEVEWKRHYRIEPALVESLKSSGSLHELSPGLFEISLTGVKKMES